MNCERMEALLLAVIDGRATPEERERVSGHVVGCATCARRMEEMTATWSVLSELPAVEPSAWFDARLRAWMSEPAPKSSLLGRLPGGLRWVALAAALGAVALWISLRPPLRRPVPAPSAQNQEDFAVIKNLPELENYDVISNFEALSALPGAQAVNTSQQME
jgi:anti-sigma factor RsiW